MPPKFDLTFTDQPPSAFLDWYKLTMLKAYLHQLDHSRGIKLEFRNTVRTKNANTNELYEGVMAALGNFDGRPVLTFSDRMHLANIPYMQGDFQTFVRDLRLHPNDDVEVRKGHDGDLEIRAHGGITATLYETIILAIVEELDFQRQVPEGERINASKAGLARLHAETQKIKQAVASHPGKEFRLTEAGTRRRASLAHQAEALKLLQKEIPDQLFGTSNIHFAFELGLRAVGTQAHEFGMLFQQHMGSLHDSVRNALQAWVHEYRGDLGYALPDVLTTPAFLQHFDKYFAKLFDGLRHDSGDPHVWTKLVVEHLRSLGVDPAGKFAVYSDSLNFEKAIDLWSQYEGNPWKTSYLIGTFITNNLPGVRALSQVMKLVSVNGQPVAKISDEPGKATCISPEHLINLKRTFGIN